MDNNVILTSHGLNIYYLIYLVATQKAGETLHWDPGARHSSRCQVYTKFPQFNVTVTNPHCTDGLQRLGDSPKSM